MNINYSQNEELEKTDQQQDDIFKNDSDYDREYPLENQNISEAQYEMVKIKGLQFTYDCGDEPEEEDDEVRTHNSEDDDNEQDDILIVEGEDDYDEASSPEFR